MQKNSKKNMNAATPIYKPFLRGNMISALAAKRGLKIFALLAVFAFFGVLVSGVLAFNSALLRILMNGVLLAFGCMVMMNEGSRHGEADVTFAEIALKRQEEGKEVTAKDRDVCYHPGKGLFTALIGVAPFLLAAIVYAFIAKKQTFTLGVLPSWVQGYEKQSEVGQALSYYHESFPITLEQILRLIMRLMLFPYMNMLGGGDFGRLLVLDRISPLLTLIVPAFYGIGYLRGPRLRAMVHGNIRLARRRHNRKERKAREQRMRKEPQKKELI